MQSNPKRLSLTFYHFFSHLLDTSGVVFCWILAVLVGTDDSTVVNCIFQLFMRTCICVVWVVSLSSDVLIRSPASSFSREERANSEVFLLSIWKQNNRVVDCSKMLYQVSGVSRTLQVPLAFKERGQMRIVSYFSEMLVLAHLLEILWVSNKLFLTSIRALILVQTSVVNGREVLWVWCRSMAIHRPRIRQCECLSCEREFGASVEIYLSRLKAPSAPNQSGTLWTSTRCWVTRARNKVQISAVVQENIWIWCVECRQSIFLADAFTAPAALWVLLFSQVFCACVSGCAGLVYRR